VVDQRMKKAAEAEEALRSRLCHASERVSRPERHVHDA
jgi:hypothetical protein